MQSHSSLKLYDQQSLADTDASSYVRITLIIKNQKELPCTDLVYASYSLSGILFSKLEQESTAIQFKIIRGSYLEPSESGRFVSRQKVDDSLLDENAIDNCKPLYLEIEEL